MVLGDIGVEPSLFSQFFLRRTQARHVVHHRDDVLAGKALDLFDHLLVGVSAFAVLDPAELPNQIVVMLALDQRDVLLCVTISVLPVAVGAVAGELMAFSRT